MEFCDDCGSLMRPEDGRMVCSSCGNEQPRDEERAAAFVSTAGQDESDVVETAEDVAFEGQPTTEETCEECGHDRAYYTFKQTASADEPPTRFFKCVDCGHRWRGYN